LTFSKLDSIKQTVGYDSVDYDTVTYDGLNVLEAKPETEIFLGRYSIDKKCSCVDTVELEYIGDSAHTAFDVVTHQLITDFGKFNEEESSGFMYCIRRYWYLPKMDIKISLCEGRHLTLRYLRK